MKKHIPKQLESIMELTISKTPLRVQNAPSNKIFIYNHFFEMAITPQVKRLIIVYNDHLKATPGGSQITFANLVNMSQSTVSRMLRGQYPINRTMTDAVCFKLGYSPEWFIKGNGDKKAKKETNMLTEIQMLRAEYEIVRAELEKIKADILILSRERQPVNS